MVSNSEKWGIYIVIDSLPQAGEVLHGSLPVLHQDLRGQLAPQGVQGIPVCSRDLWKKHSALLKPEANNIKTNILLQLVDIHSDAGLEFATACLASVALLNWINGLKYVI